MVSATPKDDNAQEPAPVSAGGTYKLQDVSVGCKIYIRRPNSDGEEEERLAEILSIREKPVNRYAARRAGESSESGPENPDDKLEYFVHWDTFNKRLDGWVAGSRLVLSRELQWPRPKAAPGKKQATGAAAAAAAQKNARQAKALKGKGSSSGASTPRVIKTSAPSKGKAPRGASDSLLKKASLNAAALAVGQGTPTMLTPASMGALPNTYPFSAAPSPGPSDPGSPTPSLGPSLKRKRSEGSEIIGEDEDEDAEGSIDAGSEADAEGSMLDAGELADDMDIDADGSLAGDNDQFQDHDHEQEQDEDADADGEPAGEEDEGETFELAVDVPTEPPPPLTAFSKEQEIEKLRTSGSMTQSISEIARVKNLNRLQMGKHEVEAWYFSPYPQEYAYLPVLYICEFCLSYFPSEFMLGRHRKRCNLLHPPGNEIYRKDDISFYELDGKRQLQYCRNLSLLSKCFLDHKTLYYDVTPFLYYIMCQRDSAGAHLIGYFSKEKECAENYNVACILTLPQHQRHGYGKLLIEFSYELSKKEGRLGSPEKPLSDLGLLSYRAYWAEAIVDYLMQASAQGEGEVSIDDIAQKTSVTHTDIVNTCTTLQLIKHYKGQNVIALSDAVLERHQKSKAKRRRRIDPSCLIWKPRVFTREQLRFGW